MDETMLTKKTILLFFLKCLTIYLVLVFVAIPVLKLEKVTATVICATGNTFLSNTKWRTINKGEESSTVANIMTTIKGRKISFDSEMKTVEEAWLFSFLFLISLLLALPFNWKRLSVSLLIGILAMWIYLVFFLKWSVNYACEVVAGGQPDETLAGGVFSENIGYLTIIPVFIWVLVAFRRSDWKQLAAKTLNKKQ